MKARIKFAGIGAGCGLVLLLLLRLLVLAVPSMSLGWLDSSFFLGLGLLIIGLLMLVRGGRSSKYVAAIGMMCGANVVQASINPSLAEQKEPRATVDVLAFSKAPVLFLGGAAANLLVSALVFLLG